MQGVDRKHPMLRRNIKIIKATQTHCGLCYEYVNKQQKVYTDLSDVVDHIIPVSPKHGGHLFALTNLQLAHRYCNGQKSDRLESEISELERRQWALHIQQLTAEVTPSGIDWAALVDNEDNEWLGEDYDESEE